MVYFIVLLAFLIVISVWSFDIVVYIIEPAGWVSSELKLVPRE